MLAGEARGFWEALKRAFAAEMADDPDEVVGWIDEVEAYALHG